MENQDDREKETSIVSAEKWNDGALNEAADWPLAGEWVSEWVWHHGKEESGLDWDIKWLLDGDAMGGRQIERKLQNNLLVKTFSLQFCWN